MRSGSYTPIKAAQQHLEAAQRCPERIERGLSAAEAYYAMYHVVAAAAKERGDKMPSTHEGMEWYFFHEPVRAGPLTLGDHKTHFDDAREARIRWHYKGTEPENDVLVYVDVADEMIERYR